MRYSVTPRRPGRRGAEVWRGATLAIAVLSGIGADAATGPVRASRHTASAAIGAAAILPNATTTTARPTDAMPNIAPVPAAAPATVAQPTSSGRALTAAAAKEPAPREPPSNQPVPASLPASVSIEELLRLVAARNPALAADASRVAVAESRTIEASQLPNPRVSYGNARTTRGANNINGPSHDLMMEQPLLLAGQRGLRTRAARAAVAEARAEHEVTMVDVAAEARRLFVQLLRAQAQVETLQAVGADLERIEQIVSGRVDAGVASQYDLLRVRVETSGRRTQLGEARAALDAARADVGALAGEPAWRPAATGSLHALGVPADEAALWEQARARLPRLQLAEQRIAVGSAETALARRERMPVPDVNAGLQRTNDPFGRALMLGVSVEVPLFDRGQARIARAEGETRMARLEAEAERTAARARLTRAAEQLGHRRAVERQFQTDVVDRLPQLRQQSEDAYLLGRIGIVELLDALQTHADARLGAIDLAEQSLLAEIAVLDASGGLETFLTH